MKLTLEEENMDEIIENIDALVHPQMVLQRQKFEIIMKDVVHSPGRQTPTEPDLSESPVKCWKIYASARIHPFYHAGNDAAQSGVCELSFYRRG